jgi:DNA polymerase-4
MTDRISEPILHVDMDAFFVEVERRKRPELVGRPVLVGGTGPRAVVAAASYEAREFGVGSAMPMGEAKRRCPAAIVVPPDHRAYGSTSRQVFDILRSFTPRVEGLSVDEAFLDVAGLRLHYENPVDIAEAIRARLRAELGLPASVGAATNKFLAKLASEEAKPDGVLVIAAGQELEFLHPLPVRRLWGVGEATYAALDALAIATVADLAATPLGTIEGRLGGVLGRHLWELAHGRDDRVVEGDAETKSVSVEETFSRDLHDDAAIEEALLRHCDRLSARLNAAGLAGRTITLKLRFGDFTTITRSQTIADPIDHTPDLWDAARQLLGKVDRGARGVRLLGVGASALTSRLSPRQLSLEHPSRDAAATAAEQVRARFGDDAVIPARLARPRSRETGHGEGQKSP